MYISDVILKLLVNLWFIEHFSFETFGKECCGQKGISEMVTYLGSVGIVGLTLGQ